MNNVFKMISLVGLMTLVSCGSNNVSTKTVEVVNPETEETVEVVKVLKTVKHLEGQDCEESETASLITECEEIENPLTNIVHRDVVRVIRTDVDGGNGDQYFFNNDETDFGFINNTVSLEILNNTEYRVWIRTSYFNWEAQSEIHAMSINENGKLELSNSSGKTWKVTLDGEEL